MITELEKLVDEIGPRRVVEALVEICNEHARFSGPTWVGQEKKQAWERTARLLETATCHMPRWLP